MSTSHALAESGHRFISSSGLRLRVADLLLLASTTLQTLTDTLLLLGHLGHLHVLPLQLELLLALLLALELIVSHDDELFSRNFSGQNALSEFPVGLVLEVGEKRSHLLLVIGCLSLELNKGSILNSDSSVDNITLGCRRSVGQAIVYKTNA